MKFQQLLAIQKHIEVSFSLKQPPRSFLVVHPEKGERKRLLEKIAEKIGSLSQGTPSFYEPEEWGKAYEILMSPSFFCKNEILVLDGIKTFSQDMERSLLSYILQPSPHVFLLLGGEPSKAMPPFYDKTKKELVFLDMGEEKPWEKEKRVQQELLIRIKEEGKSITPGALHLLLQSGSGDAQTVESELVKIFCFIGDKKVIVEKDVEEIATPHLDEMSWQQAERFIWEGHLSFSYPDLSFVILFIGQIRFLLNQARQVLWCQEQKKEAQEICKLANVKPFVLQKLQDRVRRYPSAYFEKALGLVYEIEKESKGGSLSAPFLLQLLQIKYVHLQRSYAK